MSIYNKNGILIGSVFSVVGEELNCAYDVSGNCVFSDERPDYSNYSYITKWASKGISNTQGFSIYDNKIFWVSKSGNNTIPANCYVWNLSDGSQAFDTAYVMIQSGHGNNLSFNFPYLYADTGYNPPVAYVNSVSNDLKTFTLIKTLIFDADGSVSMDGCIDETDSDIFWTVGHEGDPATDFIISKWNLSNLTADGDYYAPELLQSVTTPIQESYYRQGCAFHDEILWYASGYSGASTGAYVYGVDPDTGNILYTIDCETTAEPEGVAWYPDAEAAGGYALYVGFAGMALRKYTFAEAST